MALFRPSIMNQKIGYANFNLFCAERLRETGWKRSTPNPNNSPYYSRNRKDELQQVLGVDWYHGGWMERRDDVWSDIPYLKERGTFLHLGVDCSVGAGTEVLAVRNGPIVHVGDDRSDNGWGGHVIQILEFQRQTCALIYGHLNFATCTRKLGAKMGSVIGTVGDKSQNGGWGEHLHIQLWRDVEGTTDWKKFLEEHDGYATIEEIPYWARKCPDPTPLIFS